MKNIQEDRLWNRLHELGAIGRNDDGSVTRLTYTKVDQEAQSLLAKYMKSTGAVVYEDAVGNIIAEVKGRDERLPPIICGSHFDSVRNGGMFDGCLGVIGAIEVLQTLMEHQETLLRTIKVYGFKDEEGNRFPFGMVGSKSVCGLLEQEHFQVKDKDGVSLKTAIQNFGGNSEHFESCRIANPHHFVELHIEQGRVLEDKNCSVGIVSSIASMKKYTFQIHGESGHAGGLPMRLRHDPMMAACEFMLCCEKEAQKVDHAVVTFQSLTITPTSFNIVPELVEFTVDLRARNNKDIELLEYKFIQIAMELDISRGVSTTYQIHQHMLSCPCNRKTIDTLEQLCIKNEITYNLVMSGAGHDAMNFKNICPVTMIFVRSKYGYSHRKEEFTSSEDCANGVEVMYQLIKKIGNS